MATPFDAYVGGDYDVILETYGLGARPAEPCPIPPFKARPSACYDAKGRLWIAYEEGPEKWGKDFGALAGDGNPLYNARVVRVVCVEDGKLMEPVAARPVLAVRPAPAGSGEARASMKKSLRTSNPCSAWTARAASG